MDGWNGERQIGKIFGEIEPKHIARYKIAADYCKGGNVLDAACGCGYGSNLLAQEGAESVLGVDNSFEALEYAQEHWAYPTVEFDHFDLNQSDFTDLGLFDTIVCFETLEHLVPMPHSTLEKFDEILKPDGFIVYSHPEGEKPPGGRFHKHINLKGDELIKWMGQYGYKKIIDWHQPGRGIIPYRVVVLYKS